MTVFVRQTIPTWVVLLVMLQMGVASEMAWAKKEKRAKKGAELNGVVHGQEEGPLPGASVWLADPDGTVVLDTKADDEGAFSVRLKGGGAYTLRLGHPDYATWETPLEINPDEGYNLTFKLIDTATADKQGAISAFNRGADLVQAGDSAEAKSHFLQAAELDPTLAEAHLALTDVFLGEQDWVRAAESIERFRALRPDDLGGLRVAYEVYEQQGDQERAAAMLEGLRGTEFARPIAARIFNAGVAASQAGDPERARERFESAALLDPTLIEPLSGLATLAYNTEDYAAAKLALERLLTQAPDNVQGLRLRFLVHDALAETDAALEAFDAYHAVAPEAATDTLLERAEMDFRDGNTAVSKRSLERILQHHPDHPRVHYTLGLIHFQSDPARAKEYLGRFVALAPDDPDAASAREMLQHL